MVVVDSSVLILLSKIAKLGLVRESFNEVLTTDEIYREVVEEGKGRKGTSKIKESFEEWIVVENFDLEKAEEIAELEGITTADASLLLLAEKKDSILLTNDRALILVARSRNVEYYWLTTLVLKRVKEGDLGKNEALDLLDELIAAGMNLAPKVYSKLRKKIDEV